MDINVHNHINNNHKFIFDYINLIFNFDEGLLDDNNDTEYNNLIKEKIKFIIQNFKFTTDNLNYVQEKQIYNNIRRNFYECDIIINTNQLFILKTPLVKCIKNEYPYLTFELMYINDNIQVDIFEYIMNKLQNKLRLKNKTFEPFIHYNKKKNKKYFTIKYEEEYSKCLSKINTFIANPFNNDKYIDFICILSIQLNKRWVDRSNNIMGLEWIICQSKFVNLSIEFNNNIDFNNSYINNHIVSIPPPPPPPPPPMIDLNKKHEIIINKNKVLDKIIKNIPTQKMIPPSLSDIQKILEKMRKNKN